ncbi:MAG: TlpA family protein disulfide reductase [Acidimicrobiia bacterium]|nr:TlpA family protein disulfide reductase [Acidimicrobiia bacterium]
MVGIPKAAPSRFLWLLVLVIAASLLALGLATAEQRDSAEEVDASFTYFDGTNGTLANFRGKPLVLNFWASWCPACVAEMPDFQEVSERFAGRVEFLGMNMQEVSLDAALGLVEATGVEYRMAHDPDGAIFQMFGGVAMPTTVFIAATGEVVRVHAGAIFAADLVALIEQELLAG